jgi:hypothetical protein
MAKLFESNCFQFPSRIFRTFWRAAKPRNPFGKQLILRNNMLKDYSIQRAFLRRASQLASPITIRKAI